MKYEDVSNKCARNCEGVKYGFFGNLEVISKTVFSILAANIEKCDKHTVKETRRARQK